VFYKADWIFLVKVDDLCSLCLCHVETGLNRIYRKDAAGIEQLGTGDTELAHRAASENCHRIARLYLGILRGHVGGGHDVREQDGLIIIHFLGQLDGSYISKRNARFFRLQPIERSAVFGTTEKRCACVRAVGICFIALSVIPSAAIRASATTHGRADHNPVSGRQVPQFLPNFLNNANSFVSQDCAWLHACESSPDKVQVRSAYCASGDLHNGVKRLFDGWFFYVIQSNVADAMKYHCLHFELLNEKLGTLQFRRSMKLTRQGPSDH